MWLLQVLGQDAGAKTHLEHQVARAYTRCCDNVQQDGVIRQEILAKRPAGWRALSSSAMRMCHVWALLL